jgi:hypothetical protein
MRATAYGGRCTENAPLDGPTGSNAAHRNKMIRIKESGDGAADHLV